MIHLALGRLEVDWGKNNFFKDHGTLYQPDDLKDVPSYYAADDWPDGDPIVEMGKGFGKPLGQIIDRLELLGYTLQAVKHEYAELHALHGLKEQPLPFEDLREALAKVDVNQVSGNYGEDYDPGEFVAKEVLDRIGLPTEKHFGKFRSDHWEVDMLLENFHPNSGLRLLAENPVNLNLDVNWDFSPLVESGWADREEFKAGPAPEQCFLVVTEGSSDAKIIEHALKLLRPHIADFFRFVDMEEGYPFSGTGNLFRFTQGLISIGIQNQTVIVYDNDAEGIAKLNATKSLTLPHNVGAMQLPPMDCFEAFLTEGPTGTVVSDINGKAASIECYLDLSDKNLPAAVVRWSSFSKEADAWQGALMHKTQYMKRFLSMKELEDRYDTRKIESVLDSLIAECVAIAERDMMTHPLRINE